MLQKKKSFFARLTGIMDHDENLPEEEFGGGGGEVETESDTEVAVDEKRYEENTSEEEESEGELAVDLYQRPNEVILRAMVAGVKPEDLDVAITREMITIKGKRDREKQSAVDDYSHKELYWGAFSRSLVLPDEVDVDSSEANVQNGLLTIRLPKIDKKKTQKLRILKA